MVVTNPYPNVHGWDQFYRGQRAHERTRLFMRNPKYRVKQWWDLS